MSLYRRAAQRSRKTPAQIHKERCVNPWRSLAQGVVLQAIADWRTLESGARVSGAPKTTIEVLRVFFRSQWADHLLLGTDISALYILGILERELADVASGRAGRPTRKGAPDGKGNGCGRNSASRSRRCEMERLTEKHYGANDYYMTCSEECERGNCVECAELEKIVNRLGVYEDTGLTPKDCAEYRKFEDEIIASGKTFGRIVELLRADKESRVVVLPCKVGDEG